MPNSTPWNVVPLLSQQVAVYPNPYITDVPDGYDTVWGYLAKKEPHVLDIMLDPIRSPVVEQRRAQMLSLAYDYDTYRVPAPAALLGVGVPEVLAFKLEVLRQVFPANP